MSKSPSSHVFKTFKRNPLLDQNQQFLSLNCEAGSLFYRWFQEAIGSGFFSSRTLFLLDEVWFTFSGDVNSQKHAGVPVICMEFTKVLCMSFKFEVICSVYEIKGPIFFCRNSSFTVVYS